MIVSPLVSAFAAGALFCAMMWYEFSVVAPRFKARLHTSGVRLVTRAALGAGGTVTGACVRDAVLYETRGIAVETQEIVAVFSTRADLDVFKSRVRRLSLVRGFGRLEVFEERLSVAQGLSFDLRVTGFWFGVAVRAQIGFEVPPLTSDMSLVEDAHGLSPSRKILDSETTKDSAVLRDELRALIAQRIIYRLDEPWDVTAEERDLVQAHVAEMERAGWLVKAAPWAERAGWRAGPGGSSKA